LNVTCNFLYCNYQVHRDFLITLYVKAAELVQNGDTANRQDSARRWKRTLGRWPTAWRCSPLAWRDWGQEKLPWSKYPASGPRTKNETPSVQTSYSYGRQRRRDATRVKAYRASSSTAPLILNLGAMWGGWLTSRHGRFNPGKKPQ
jgi:hypothetical protein